MLAKVARHLRSHSIAYLALFVALGGTSYAATGSGPISNGMVRACYSKTTGAVRLVTGNAWNCQRGEQRIALFGDIGRVVRLEAGLAAVKSALGTLGNADLTTAVRNAAAVPGIQNVLGSATAQQLKDAVAAPARVTALCSELSKVVDQVNALRTAVKGIALAGTVPAGLKLTIPTLPEPLPTFSC